jgi:hypothetical protein
MLKEEVGEPCEFRSFTGRIEACVTFHFSGYKLILNIKHKFSISPDPRGFDSAFGAPAAFPCFQKLPTIEYGKIVFYIQNTSAITDIANLFQIIFSAAMYA